MLAVEEVSMFANLVHQIKQAIQTGVEALRKRLVASTKPTNTSLVRGRLRDLVRTKPQLIAANALLRQSGRREDITIPHPPKNRTCDFHRIRLKHVLTHQFLSSVRSAIAFPRGFVGGSTGVR